MADLLITVTNTMRTFGPWPDKWGEIKWGTDKWGEGTQDLPVDVVKIVTDATALDGLTILLASERIISNSLTLDSDATEETLKDPAGYNYLFVKPTTDSEQRTAATFSSAAAASTSWTSAAVGSTSWS